ncbi:MAG: SDR family NAD(P)-dependent oxidoreductase [Thermoguttaceae bacterium]|jgi:NAD(P)-dependent dehydrogenase (short-subunit alcohol dehydrogenase family)
MKVDLENRTALVTGAARNIGKAIADALAANGARVVYSDIDLAEVTAAAGASSGTAMHLDVADAAEVEAVTSEIVRRFGRIDILVNNAGVNTLQHRVPIDQFPPEEWERIVRVDLTGLYLVSRAVARVMRAQRHGRIVNIASVAGLVPLRLQCAFVAAKAGVVNLTRAMAIELGHLGITVNCVAPGSILTEGTKKLFYGEDSKFREGVNQLIAHIPAGRPGSPEEVAHAVAFLAAEEARYINGAVLTVDGGWTAGYAREF